MRTKTGSGGCWRGQQTCWKTCLEVSQPCLGQGNVVSEEGTVLPGHQGRVENMHLRGHMATSVPGNQALPRRVAPTGGIHSGQRRATPGRMQRRNSDNTARHGRDTRARQPQTQSPGTVAPSNVPVNCRTAGPHRCHICNTTRMMNPWQTVCCGERAHRPHTELAFMGK